MVKFYNFENSPFNYFSVINLKNENFKYQDFLDAAKYVNVELDADKLYDDICLLKNIIPSTKSTDLLTDKKIDKNIFLRCFH